ncbi:hypothetical protein Tco_0268722 [Tanacetum coccineum]
MASLDRRLNPLYAIKECSSYGDLYTKDCGCSKGSLEDKILVPIPDLSQRPLKIENFCLDCGDPVHGLYCRQCALIRKTLEEVFQDFQDTSKSSNDDTNFVNQEPFVVKQGPGVNSSQSPPQINHNCCYECGDSLDDIFCQRCTCKSCGKGAHYGYNCPPQIPIISKPEPCNNQTVNEFPQTLPSVQPTSCTGDENSFTYDSKPNFVDDSPNVFNPPPQPPMYSCEFCGNDARYGHYCTPQVPFIYPEPGYNQDFNFPQNFHGFPQQYPCCENCGGPHETYQCQPMNEDYYHEQNSCYDYNSFGFDQFQPPQYTVNHPIFNSQNELLNSQNEFLNTQNELLNSSNKLMEQMTTLCDLVGQAIQKKEEEKRIAEEQAAKDRYWKIPICYDDDDDYTIAITPILPTKEPVNSLSMGDEHLDTIPATESDEVIKSSVENIVPIPREYEVTSDNESECDVSIDDESSPTFTTFSNSLFDSDDDFSSSDDESFSHEDVPKEIYSNPLFDEEIISGKIDASIISSPKIDSLLEQFSGELAHIDLIPPGINDDNLDPEGDILFLESLLYDNSSPRPLEEFNYENPTKSFSPSPIPVEDSDSLMEEIDIFLDGDDSIPPGIENDDFDSEDDDNSTSHIPVDVPNILPTHPALQLDFDFISSNDLGSDLDLSSPSEDSNKIYDPGICIEVESTRFLSTLSPVIDTLLSFSYENKDKVFNHGVLASKEKSPPSSSHRGLKVSKLFHQKSPMLIHGDNTPNLGVRHPHFYHP